ncbi:MAG: hypothetical protein KAS70_05440 [Planctomycetes bacterium]|nr:hypothetical protein [Planctomycetota bacterium]MCK5579116.1 hypothetical protein [Planctomycetota bacterium]
MKKQSTRKPAGKKEAPSGLDEINLLWVLQQISVGNLVRGVNWVFGTIKNSGQHVRRCVLSTAGIVKKRLEEAEDEERVNES